jgi:recombination protein RecA
MEIPQIDKLLEKINKSLGSSQIVRASNAHGLGYKRYSTGIIGLDILCGGSDEGKSWGIPSGRITEFWGEEGSGKTTAALNCIRLAQEEGNVGAFINMEGAWDSTWAEKIGVDLSKMIIARPPSSEDLQAVMRELITTAGIGVIVVDSIAMMTSTSELLTDTREKNIQPGTQPRAVNVMVRHLASAFNRWPIDAAASIFRCPAVIFLNQVRQKIGGYGDPDYSPGGKGKDHQCSLKIRMRKGERIKASKNAKAEDPVLAIKLKGFCGKNKVWAPYSTCEFKLWIRNVKAKDGIHHAGEVDRADELFRLGMVYGLVTRSGNKYEYQEKYAVGEVAFRQGLNEDKEMAKSLEEAIYKAAWEKGGT